MTTISVPRRAAIDPAAFTCPNRLPVTVSARSPEYFGGWLHGMLVESGAQGAVLRPITGRTELVVGREQVFTVTVPFVGAYEVGGTPISTISTERDSDGNDLVGVEWIDPPVQFLAALAEYLMLAGTGLTPVELRTGGLPVGSAVCAVSYGCARRPQDDREILDLRIRAHQREGRLSSMSWADLVSPFDVYARHLVCRYGSRVVGYVRVILVESDPARSQYVSWGGHEVPRQLWEEGFVESGAGAIDPDFQRASLFLPLMQRCVRVAVETGSRHLLGACEDDLLDMYRSMGFVVLESRDVEPRSGWRFRSHLINLDLDRLVAGHCRGRSVAAMREAALSSPP